MQSRKVEIPLYMLLLIISSFTDIYLVNNIKLVYAFAIMSLLYVLRYGFSLLKKDFYILLWYGSYFLSIGHIISMHDFIIVSIGQLILFVIYFNFKSIKSRMLTLKCDSCIQKSLYFMVIIGVIQLAAYYIFGLTWGISHLDHGVGLPRMAGLSLEPDWYGVICMMALIFMTMNYINKSITFGKKIDILLSMIIFTMLILNLTRAAWVGYVAAMFSLFIVKKQTKLQHSLRAMRKKILVIMPLISFIVLGLWFSENETFLKVLQRMNVLEWAINDGGATDTRFSSINIMLYYFMMHPFTGNGVGSMGMISSDTSLLRSLGYMYSINEGRGNANLIITNLFDVGVFGTMLLIIFLYKHLKRLIVFYQNRGEERALTYFVLLIALLIDFQFNNGFRQAYVWIILGVSDSIIKNSINNIHS